ncbi:MAG: ABC-2 transporter permease [Oscillospiraceae bacterium]
MKGLLLKDFYVLTGQMKFFLILMLVFAVVPGASMSAFAVVYAAMLPYTTLAYDERSKWDVLAGMLPYTTRDMVLSKYVLGYLATGGALLVTALGKLILPFSGNRESLAALLPVFAVALLLLAVTLPFMFRFGVEKGRMVFVMIMAFAAVGTNLLMQSMLESPKAYAALPALSLWFPLVAVAANLLSIGISLGLYAKREH